MRCLSFLNLQLGLDHLELVEDVNELFEKHKPLLRVLWYQDLASQANPNVRVGNS